MTLGYIIAGSQPAKCSRISCSRFHRNERAFNLNRLRSPTCRIPFSTPGSQVIRKFENLAVGRQAASGKPNSTPLMILDHQGSHYPKPRVSGPHSVLFAPAEGRLSHIEGESTEIILDTAKNQKSWTMSADPMSIYADGRRPSLQPSDGDSVLPPRPARSAVRHDAATLPKQALSNAGYAQKAGKGDKSARFCCTKSGPFGKKFVSEGRNRSHSPSCRAERLSRHPRRPSTWGQCDETEMATWRKLAFSTNAGCGSVAFRGLTIA